MSDSVRIEFPCDYPIHVIGERADDFRDAVLDIVRDAATAFYESSVDVRESRVQCCVELPDTLRPVDFVAGLR